MELQEAQDLLRSILYVSCGLGAAGSVLIIITYIFYAEIRNRFGISLIFYLSISNFLNCVAFFPWNVDEVLCIMQAMFIHYFQVASYFWSAFIAFSVFAVIYLDKMFDILEIDRYMRWFHAIAWVAPFLSVLPPLFLKRYGFNNPQQLEPWCFTAHPNDWTRLFVYGPCMVIIVFCCVIFIVIQVKLNKWKSPSSNILRTSVSLYVAAFVVSQLATIVNRIQNYLHPDHPILILLIFQTALLPLQGFWNALIFVSTEPDFVEYCSLVFGCWRRKRVIKSEAETANLINYDYDYDCEDA